MVCSSACLPRPARAVCRRFLGGGAFGHVYLARWRRTEVAVKCLSPSLICGHGAELGADAAVAELMLEASTLSNLHHPNIVSVYGVVLPPSSLLTSSNLVAASSMGIQASGGEPGTSPGSSAASQLSDSGLLGMDARSALSQGHPPAPAVVTEYLAGGSLRAAIRGKAPWLRGQMATIKVLLDAAQVRQSHAVAALDCFCRDARVTCIACHNAAGPRLPAQQVPDPL